MHRKKILWNIEIYVLANYKLFSQCTPNTLCISFNRHQIYYFYFYFYSYKGRHHNYMMVTRMLMICLFIPSDIISSHLFYLFILFSSHLYTKYHIDLYVYRMGCIHQLFAFRSVLLFFLSFFLLLVRLRLWRGIYLYKALWFSNLFYTVFGVSQFCHRDIYNEIHHSSNILFSFIVDFFPILNEKQTKCK